MENKISSKCGDEPSIWLGSIQNMDVPCTSSQLKVRLKYDDVRENRRNVLHLGQLKLLISEICFLTKFAHNENITVVYVGAAGGYHILKLSELFPNMIFKLYDPQKFSIIDTDRITIFNKFFTEKDAESYSKIGESILFISDIRNVPTKNPTEVGIDRQLEEAVTGDMQLQLQWVNIIKPIAASLKFRLPYDGVAETYFDGFRMLQPYAPFSTEVRLFTTTYTTLVKYDCMEFDEKMAYFNSVVRFMKFRRWDNIMRRHGIVNNWDNSFAFNVLLDYMNTISSKNTVSSVNDDLVVELFEEIVDFLGNYYGRKYNYLFY
jgi:hypothetical protein